MKIILNNEYSIEQDTYCYILKKTTITYGNADNKSDKPRISTKTICYPHTLEDAIEKFIKLTIDDKTKDFEGDLKEYVKRIKEICDYAVNEVAKGVKKC